MRFDITDLIKVLDLHLDHGPHPNIHYLITFDGTCFIVLRICVLSNRITLVNFRNRKVDSDVDRRKNCIKSMHLSAGNAHVDDVKRLELNPCKMIFLEVRLIVTIYSVLMPLKYFSLKCINIYK